MEDAEQRDADIPDIVRAWCTSVRRPVVLPAPNSYHEAISLNAIFELDKSDDEGNKKSIFVVPRRCHYCVSVAQACSRMLPTCFRCAKSGRSCIRVGDGYDPLPRPKLSKSRKNKSPDSGDEFNFGDEDGCVRVRLLIIPCSLVFPDAPSSDRKKVTRRPRKSIPEKRPGSPQEAVPPPSKKRSRKVAADLSGDEPPPRPRGSKAAKAAEKSRLQPTPVDVLPTGSEPRWSFVKPSSKKVAQLSAGIHAPRLTPFTGRPRVWTHVGIYLITPSTFAHAYASPSHELTSWSYFPISKKLPVDLPGQTLKHRS